MVFTKDEQDAFHIITNHPGVLALLDTTFEGKPVATIVVLRPKSEDAMPLAIILNNELMDRLAFDGQVPVRPSPVEPGGDDAVAPISPTGFAGDDAT